MPEKKKRQENISSGTEKREESSVANNEVVPKYGPMTGPSAFGLSQDALRSLNEAARVALPSAEVLKGSGIVLSEMSKAAAKATEGLNIQGMATALSSVALAANQSLTEVKGEREMSEGEKEFESLFQLITPKDPKECLTCVKQSELLMEIIQEIEKSGSYSKSSMLLEKRDLDKVKHRKSRIDERIRLYREKHSPYDIALTEQNVDYLLYRNGLTRADLGRILGVGQSYFNRAFNAGDSKRRVSIDVMCQTASLFDESIERILNEDISKTNNVGESKTVSFTKKIIEATRERKMKWEPYKPGGNTSKDADKEVSELYDESPFTTKVWMTETVNGMMYFSAITGDYDGESYEGYRVGADKGERFRWLFDTTHNFQGLRTQCRQLREIIEAFESAGFVSAEAEEMMDEILNGLEEPEELPFN